MYRKEEFHKSKLFIIQESSTFSIVFFLFINVRLIEQNLQAKSLAKINIITKQIPGNIPSTD